jgi:AraC family transcriptional activator FtrA
MPMNAESRIEIQAQTGAFPDRVAVVIYDGIGAFTLGLALEVFGRALPDEGYPGYELSVVSADRRRVTAFGGLRISATAGIAGLREARIILIPAWRSNDERPPERLLSELRRAAARGAILVSICDGAFVLAHAGLLDGRRATTHWADLADLKAQFPEIRTEDNVLYVDEGNIITSAGGASGIDACLHLVRRDFGTRIANAVARRMVIPPHRDGGQRQYVATPIPDYQGRTLSVALDWARSQLHRPVSVAEFAREAAMSERTFLRRFQDEVGVPPKAWLAAERMRLAQEILESTETPLAEVGQAVGYTSPETFRSAFRRIVGVPPSTYRDRFRQL